jgi:PAS domain S-box-containing protein
MPETRSEKFLCLGYDVTGEEQQRKTMQAFESDYQTGNALFTSFMDHSPYFTWIIDEDENLMFANRSLLEYFNLDTTVFGRKLDSLIPGPIARIFQDKHNHTFKSGRRNKSLVKSLTPDGKEHVYQVIVFPIHGAGPGKIAGGEAQDVTASYNARQAIISAREKAARS